MSDERLRVRARIANGVGYLTLARPSRKNALDAKAASDILHVLTDHAQRTDVRVIVLDAEGDDFCAGADLTALAAMLDAPVEQQHEDAALLGEVFVAMRALPKPIVAVVKGRALAGGAGLATAADIVFAHEDAEFGYPETRVGFVPAMVMTILRRLAGEKRALELVLTGRRIGAREAMEIGLVSRVFERKTFEADIAGAIAELAKGSLTAQGMTKRLFYALDGKSFEEGIAAGARTNAEARSTEDFKAGVRRFAR